MKTQEKAIGWGPGGQGGEGGKGEEGGMGGDRALEEAVLGGFTASPLCPRPGGVWAGSQGQWGACALTLPTVSPSSWLASARARGLGIH